MIYAAYSPTTGQIKQIMMGPYADCSTAASVSGLTLIEVSAGVRDDKHMVVDGVITPVPSSPGASYQWDWTSHTWVDPRTVTDARLQKGAQINRWRMIANRGSFPYGGKQIACDELSRSDIDGVNGMVALNNALPVDFPGAWKATDNTYVVISTVQQWKDLYAAMIAQGTANFLHSQTLKAQIADPGMTVADIDAVQW